MKYLILCSRRYSKQNLVNLLLKMPKDKTEHVVLNQKNRIRIREKSKFYSPGTVNLQVLGSGARGSSSSVYLFSEQTRYLFNCGEGSQRLAHEHKTKLARMENIFLTRNTWDRFGGVPGLCLTLQDIGVPQLNLHGPPGIDRIFESARKFVVLRNMTVETPDCHEGAYFEDSVMRVNYVPLCKTVTPTEDQSHQPAGKTNTEKESQLERKEENFKDDTDYYGYENNKKINKNLALDRSKESSLNKTGSNNLKIDNIVMAFICKLKERAGTLDLEKCLEKGVKPGPLLGRLKNGFDVTLQDGSIVKANDVRGQASPGSVFAFVDIPDEGYLQALKNSEAFKAHQKQAVKEDDAALIVVHFSPENIMTNPVYVEWMEQFIPSTMHWFVNERNEFTGFFASHRIQRQLNELDTNVFPMLKEQHPYLRHNIDNTLKTDPVEENPSKICKTETQGEPIDKFKDYPELGILSTFHIRPPRRFDRNLEPYSNPEKVAEETMETPELAELINSFKKEAKKLVVSRSQVQRAEEYPKIITFGTGSCIPNKTRNVSANLVHISENNCALLDCGEGTLGQLVRFFGRDGADHVLKNLRMIYISHLHADHHLGLIDILNRRRKVTNEKVLLLAPSQISAWLSFYNYRIEEIFSTYDLFPCSHMLSWNVDEDQREEVYKRVGLVKIDTCYVHHCPYSYGIALEMKNLMKSDRHPGETVKITYSGDTLPCADLVYIGQNSDVLIHEATMEDDLLKEAKIKMHSTVSQAIDVGKRMNAKFVILTHFSQRYAKIPRMELNVENVAIGFDNMEVTLNDLPMMHLMYEPLKVMFCDHFDLMEQKALKRKYQQERKIEINLPNGNKHNKVTKFASSGED